MKQVAYRGWAGRAKRFLTRRVWGQTPLWLAACSVALLVGYVPLVCLMRSSSEPSPTTSPQTVCEQLVYQLTEAGLDCQDKLGRLESILLGRER